MLQKITVQSPERQGPQEMILPAGSSARSISLSNIGYLYSAVVAICSSMLDKQTLPAKVTLLCLFSLSTPQSVSAGIVIKWRFVHWCRPVLGHIPLCGCVMESMKQRILMIWSKQEWRSQMSLYSENKWSYETARLSWSTSAVKRVLTDHLFHLHILAGVCLFCPTSTHTVKFHTYTEWIINIELDLAPLTKSLRVQQCLNSSAAVTRQADATRTHNRDEVSMEKGAFRRGNQQYFYRGTSGCLDC